MLRGLFDRPETSPTPSTADDLARVEAALAQAEQEDADLREEWEFLGQQVGDVTALAFQGANDQWDTAEASEAQARRGAIEARRVVISLSIPRLKADVDEARQRHQRATFHAHQAQVRAMMADYELSEAEIHRDTSALCTKLEDLGALYLDIEAEKTTLRAEAQGLKMPGIGFTFDPQPITQRILNAVMNTWRRAVDR
jgi:chromosome segregation ATPase